MDWANRILGGNWMEIDWEEAPGKAVFWSPLSPSQAQNWGHVLIPASRCPVYIYRNILCFLFIHTHTYITHTEGNGLFTMSRTDISNHSMQCFAIELKNVSSECQENSKSPGHHWPGAQRSAQRGLIVQGTRCIFTTTCLLSPITYRPALSLQKWSLVLQKTHIVQSFILRI